ncbi:hypothetical protein R1flu_028523 [Riccia fluitans]|uniref:Amine oxidase domain-containing protein n=1 Tax=Riccia fluitans TaxID=41844 RepID=A0ABD1XLX7_9MARC
MHSLVAAQQQVLTSISRASQSLPLGTYTSTSSSSRIAFSSVTGLRIRRVRENRNCSFTAAESKGRNSLGYGSIRSMASRKDRRDAANNEPSSFKPDIAGLKSGLAKRFPTEASNFTYDWDSDDEEDEDVEIRSFAGRRDSPKEISRSSNRGGDEMRSSSSGGAARKYSGGYPNRSEKPGKWTPKGSRDQYGDGDGENRRFSGIGRGESPSVDPAARNREAFERRMNGGKPVASAAQSNRFSSGRGQGQVSQNSAGSDASGARNSRTSNSGSARSSRDGRNGAAVKPSENGSFLYDRTGRREWVNEADNKKKPVIEPVNFETPMNKTPNIAILGGGMSGLICALRLEELGINSTVFDTGKHGLGGRMATRTVMQRPGLSPLEFDHAAQFFTVTDPWLQSLVGRWISEGAVSEWRGRIGNLQAGGSFTELPAATRYVGTKGMRYLADHMVSGARRIEVRRPCWISKMMAHNGRWSLMENNKFQGEFDAVVIAHNGKCANRLLAPAGVPLIARMMKRLELSSIWALLAAFGKPLPSVSFEGAFVDGVSSLSWMGNNSAKFRVRSDDQPLECWTFFSTALYGKKNKVPQESIPQVKAEKVLREMLVGVETALGLPAGSMPAPLYHRLQLWGAGLPTNTPDTPCIFDAQGRVGICGDWLLGSSLEAAALSGKALAEQIAKYRDFGDNDPLLFSVGLQSPFKSVDGHDIGQFPGSSDLPKETRKEAVAAV